MDKIEPLPCPFCGKVPSIVCPDNSYGEALITCGDAHDCPVDLTAWAELNDGETLADAVSRWNTRAPRPVEPLADNSDLVERGARAIRDLTGNKGYDYIDFCRAATKAALAAIPDQRVIREALVKMRGMFNADGYNLTRRDERMQILVEADVALSPPVEQIEEGGK